MVRLHKIPGVRYVPQIEYRPAKSALWALAVAVIGYVSLTTGFGASRDTPQSAQPVPSPTPSSQTVRADLTGDGRVTAADLSVLLQEWGGAGDKADVDGDGTVGAGDMSVLMSQWKTDR